MITHDVKTGNASPHQGRRKEHKKIYVACVASDVRYRDMAVNARQRWEFYTKHTFDFSTFDRNTLADVPWKSVVERLIRESDGMMMMVSEQTAPDADAAWQIECALENETPIVGVDIRKYRQGDVPEQLVGKMTRFGWEWFADFIDSL